MPAGTCDPASRGREYDDFIQKDGLATFYGQYGWDGVSVRPDCDGPISLIRLINESPDESWYLHLIRPDNSWTTIELPPNSNREITDPQELSEMGMGTWLAIGGIYLNQSASHPVVSVAKSAAVKKSTSFKK